MSKELKARNEMDPRFQWKLEDIFATPKAFEDELAAVGGLTAGIAGGKGHVAEDPGKYIRMYFAVMSRIEKLFSYAMMAHDSDGSNGTYTAWLGRVQTVAVSTEAAGAYLTPELLAMPEKALKALRAQTRARQGAMA